MRLVVASPAAQDLSNAIERDLVYDRGKRCKEGGSLQIIRSHGGVPIRLTDERWKHISENHPEMGLMRQEVLETIAEPDLIQQGDSGELLAVRRYDLT